jgi:hypothetical protein
VTQEDILKELNFMLEFSDGRSLKALIKRLIAKIEEGAPPIPTPPESEGK